MSILLAIAAFLLVLPPCPAGGPAIVGGPGPALVSDIDDLGALEIELNPGEKRKAEIAARKAVPCR